MKENNDERNNAIANVLGLKKSLNDATNRIIELYMYAVNINDAELIAECSLMNSKLIEVLGKVDDINGRIGGRR